MKAIPYTKRSMFSGMPGCYTVGYISHNDMKLE